MVSRIEDDERFSNVTGLRENDMIKRATLYELTLNPKEYNTDVVYHKVKVGKRISQILGNLSKAEYMEVIYAVMMMYAKVHEGFDNYPRLSTEFAEHQFKVNMLGLTNGLVEGSKENIANAIFVHKGNVDYSDSVVNDVVCITHIGIPKLNNLVDKYLTNYKEDKLLTTDEKTSLIYTDILTDYGYGGELWGIYPKSVSLLFDKLTKIRGELDDKETTIKNINDILNTTIGD